MYFGRIRAASFALVWFSAIWLLAASQNEREEDMKIDIRFNAERPFLFEIFVDQTLWFQSSDVFFRSQNQTFSTADGSAKLLSQQESDGEDKLGLFRRYDLSFGASTDPTSTAIAMVGSIKQYASFVLFEQSFPAGLSETSTSNADGLVTGFPTFSLSSEDSTRGFAHWISWYYDANPTNRKLPDGESPSDERRKLLVAPGFATPVYGRWDAAASPPGGIGGSGVTAVYDRHAQYCAVIGAFAHPMALSSYTPAPGTVQYGVMGNSTSLPADFHPQILLSFSKRGVTHGLLSFGKLFLDAYNKQPGWQQRDLTLRWLGYTTDNGAYYYYHTLPNASYDATLRAVHRYAQKEGIPYRYFLLDSWWYYKGGNGGVSEWTALPSVFPHGISALTNATGLYIQAHNRYWAWDNLYKDKYHFILDDVRQGAVPADDRFWPDLLREGAKDWKLVVYEQDWLWNEFDQYVGPMLEDVYLGRQWLQQMNQGASTHGLAIQYCMPFIRHLLQSTEMSAVTQARASDDYVVSPYEGVDNWRIGGQSLLITALGLLPSKDGFWSSSYQAGNPYGEERYGAYPRLQSAVTSLSGGPVAIADGIGYTDKELVLRACDKDGRLLFPSKPATSLDIVFAQQLRSDAHDLMYQEVWAAHTFVPVISAADVSYLDTPLSAFFSPSSSSLPSSPRTPTVTFTSLFATDIVQTDLALTPDMVGYPATTHSDAPVEYFVRENNDTHAQALQRWTQTAPLHLAPCDEWSFQLYTVSPVLPGGWALLGEVHKWVAVSAQRFVAVHIPEASSSPMAFVRGAAQEKVTIAWRDPQGLVRSVPCTFPNRTSSQSVPAAWKATVQQEIRLDARYPDLPRTVYMTIGADGTCA